MNWSAFFLAVVPIAGIYAILCLSLNIEFGYGGLVNFGKVGSFAVGAYTYAILTDGPPGALSDNLFGYSFPLWVGALGAIVAGVVFAFLIGWPTLRLRGEYFALTAFAFAEVVYALARNARWLTNGSVGFVGLERPFATQFTPAGYRWFFIGFVLLFLVLAFLLSERIGRSPYGRILRAIRDDEAGAEAAGRTPRYFRLSVFVLSSAMAAFAGVLYTWYATVVTPQLFTAQVTFIVFIALVLGGVGSNYGAVVGAFVLIGFEELVRFLQFAPDVEARVSGIRVALTGLLFIVLLRVRPAPGEGPLGEWLSRTMGRLRGRDDTAGADPTDAGPPDAGSPDARSPGDGAPPAPDRAGVTP